VKRLRTGDGISVNELGSICATSSAAELARVVPSLSSFGKQRAAMCLERISAGGPVLVKLFEDPDPMVRSAAARGLEKVSDPSIADGLLRALAQPNEGVLRGKLYLALGRSLPAGRIEELRALAQKEPRTETFTSADPSNVALFALAKLGGAPERRALFAAVQAVKPARGDDPHAVTELLVDYLADRAFAKALTPWLADQTNVDSSHQASYRACDLAVLTVKRLGVDVGVDAAGIRKYDATTLARARAKLDALPAP
jgi:HEAT repeat protein